jgi:serine/threonine-protein kinase
VDPQQDIPFEKIGGYRVIRRLATGGTSDVLLARAEGPHGFERTVVLKLLLAHFRNEELMEKMFAREAAAYARLSHPAIVKLYDFFSAEGQLVMVLEYVDGVPLNKLRAMLKASGESLDDRASIFIAARIFAALAAAHGARDPESGEFAPVIHRDVNPSNVLIPWDGHVKLADFGIAKVAGVQGDTQAGFIKGTYGYMAPEQVRGEPVTVRADVYAASLLLWELLARRKAIQRGALPEMEVLRAMAEPSIVSLDVLRPDLPERLRLVVARGLEPSPDARSLTADEMLAVLRDSVGSNEGRNVLVDTLMRVRPSNPDLSMTQSRPPPDPLREIAAQTGFDVLLERRPSLTPGPLPLARTSAGLGGVASSVSASQALARSEPPPAPGQRISSPDRWMVEEEPIAAPDTEAEPGSYRAVGTGVRPVRQERTMRGLSPMQLPPDFDLEQAAPPIMPQAPVILGPPSLPPVFGSTLTSRPPPALAIASPSAPMAVPLSTPPPPPPDVATFDPFPVNAMGTPAAPLYLAPTPTPAPTEPMNGAAAYDTRSQPTITSEARQQRINKWVFVLGIAFVASAVLFVTLLLRRDGTKGAKPAASASASAAPVESASARAVASAPPAASASVAVTAAPTASAAPSAAPAASASAAPSAVGSAAASAAIPMTSSTMGDVKTPAAIAGHRNFVDDKVVGTTPDTVHVRCGSHTIKLGSRGMPQLVEVPCGGEISISEH